MRTFYGIYRAVVVNAADPLRSRRVQIQVPDILGAGAVWALPCLPVSSRAIPKVGAGVWVMFEAGDPSRPVWMGVFSHHAP